MAPGVVYGITDNSRPSADRRIGQTLANRIPLMSQRITIRLTKELAAWLDQAAKTSGIPRSRIIREHLDWALAKGREQRFMKLAGTVHGPRGLSTRKGFARS